MRKYLKYVSCLALFLFVLTTLAALQQHHNSTVDNKAIVISESASVKSSPSETSTDLFTDAIAFIENASGTKYEADEKLTKSMRILADHMRTSVMLMGDAAKLLPSNVGAGYVLRRLIRRAVRHGRTLGLNKDKLIELSKIYIDEVYG